MKHHHLGKRGLGISLALVCCLAGSMIPAAAFADEVEGAPVVWPDVPSISEDDWTEQPTYFLFKYYEKDGVYYAKSTGKEPFSGFADTFFPADANNAGMSSEVHTLVLCEGFKSVGFNVPLLKSGYLPNLETVYIPASVMKLSENVFTEDGARLSGLTKLQHVYIAPGSLLSTLGSKAFSGCSISEIDLHDTEIESLTDYADAGGPFAATPNAEQGKLVVPLKKIYLPQDLKQIETAFFESCGELTDLYIYSADVESTDNLNPGYSSPTWSNVTVHCVDMTQEEIDNAAAGTLIDVLKKNGVPEDNFIIATTSDPEPAPGVGDGEGDESDETDPGATTPEAPATPTTPTTPTVPSNPSTSNTVTGGGSSAGATVATTKTVAQKLTVSNTAKTFYASSLSKGKLKAAKSFTLKTAGAKGKLTYRVSAYGSAAKKYKKYISVSSTTGKVTLKKGLPMGTYTFKVKVAAAKTSVKSGSVTTAYPAASKTVTVKVTVGAQTASVTAKATAKASTLKKKKVALSLKAKTTSGKITKVSNASTDKTAKKFTVKRASNSKITVTVPKGTKKGTYTLKVKVTAPKVTGKYLKTTVTKTVKITVK